MSIRIVQLGSRRHKTEGVRIGTVRRPPRGVLKKDHAKLDFYDVWMPELAPSESLLKSIRASPGSPENWKGFILRYAREMERPPAIRIINLLSLLSHTANFSLGCYCLDENRCHRSVLKALLKKHGASIARS
jgi:uncharacterized protein YeaO (DUF488 family)